jgi:hypothetical protein
MRYRGNFFKRDIPFITLRAVFLFFSWCLGRVSPPNALVEFTGVPVMSFPQCSWPPSVV